MMHPDDIERKSAGVKSLKVEEGFRLHLALTAFALVSQRTGRI